MDPAARPEPSQQGGLIDTKLMNVGPLHKVTLTQSDIIGMVVAQAQKKEVSVGCDVGIFWSGNTDLIQTI